MLSAAADGNVLTKKPVSQRFYQNRAGDSFVCPRTFIYMIGDGYHFCGGNLRKSLEKGLIIYI